MSAAGAATAAVNSSSAKAARKAPDSTKPAPKAVGGLKIQGAAKNKAQGGGEAEGSKAGGGGPGKSEGGGPTRKKSRKGSNPSNPTLISESKAKGTGGGGGQAARPDAPLWRSKQALKNKAGLDLPPASTTSSRPPQPLPTVEPLKVTNRARLPTFNRKAPSSMYHSPFLPHSFSTASDPRSTAPEYTEGQSALHRAVQASWVLSQPSAETIAARKAAMDKVAQATAAFEGTFELALFGSVANGVDNDLSDLDVCVVDTSRPFGYDTSLDLAKTRRGIYNMYQLGDKLSLYGMTDVVAIPQASTPIVKCKDPDSNIELDLNVNNLGGVYNTHLIESYCYLSPYALRPLLNAVKQWGKARCVASQSTNQPTLSSYALNLLCIAYLQSTQPTGSTDGLPYLPNLQAHSLLSRYNVPRSSIHVRVGRKNLSTEINTTFAPVCQHGEGGLDGGAWGMPQDDIQFWQGRNANVDLGGLVRGFFRFYAGEGGHAWDWSKDGCSILRGGRFSRRQVSRRNSSASSPASLKGEDEASMEVARPSEWSAEEGIFSVAAGTKVEESWGESSMVVQDPFIVSKNCARPINPSTAREIVDEFARAAKVLASDRPDAFQELCVEYLGVSGRAQKPTANFRGGPNRNLSKRGRGGGGKQGKGAWQ